MKIIILSRVEAQHIVPDLTVSNAVISITDPDDKAPAKFSTHDFTKHVLYLKFYDLDGNNQRILELLPEKFKNGLFTDNQAIQILDFVEKVKDEIDTLVVHCEAGISRSSGVAAALSSIYYGSDIHIFLNRRYCPNMFVYRKILNEYNKR